MLLHQWRKSYPLSQSFILDALPFQELGKKSKILHQVCDDEEKRSWSFGAGVPKLSS
jgi:hypothetical protein